MTQERRLPDPVYFEFLSVRARAIRALMTQGFEPSEVLKMINVIDENQIAAIHIVHEPKLPCPHCSVPVAERLQHYDDSLGCWQCRRPDPLTTTLETK